MIFSLPTTLHTFISYLLFSNAPHIIEPTVSTTFHLRHQHGVSLHTSRNVFSDVPGVTALASPESFSIPTKRITVPRPRSNEAFSEARLRSLKYSESLPLEWGETVVPGPDVSKRDTLLTLAKMTSNSYFEPADASWYDLNPDWNGTYPYGWEPESDGFRGHVFVSTDNSTVVVSIKGTDAGWIAGGGGPTMKKDKQNDNLLFSCCCARVGPTWSTVCDCHDSGYRCDQKCVEKALVDDSLFYPIALNLYNNLTYMYPEANIWLTGHSLGGGIAALLGATFGAPVVAFESPGDRMAARRLHLPSPPSLLHITHVYHTADPIPMGTCTGVTSSCALAGFALESHCHQGRVIQFDTVQKLSWSVDVRTHPIRVVLERLLGDKAEWRYKETEPADDTIRSMWWPWGKGGDKPEPEGLPDARPAEEVEGDEDGVCTDCYSWQYGNYKNLTLTDNWDGRFRI